MPPTDRAAPPPVLRAPPDCPLVRDSRDPCPCLLEGVLNLIGRKWSILILGTLGNFGRLRFNELQRKLGNVSSKTLAARLKELVRVGFLYRESFDEMPPRTLYSLTAEGEALRQDLLPLMRWATVHDHAASASEGASR